MDDRDDLYQALILERARSPRHGTLLSCHDAEAEGDNPMCGDRLTLRLRHDPSGRIEAAGFSARGCAITLASADLMAECVIGLDRAQAEALAARFSAMLSTGDVPDESPFEVLGALRGVHDYRTRRRCATLPWAALVAALGARDGKAAGAAREAVAAPGGMASADRQVGETIDG